MEEADEEEYSGGKSKIILFLVLTSGEPGDDLQEGDEPSSPDMPKKTRPARACDFCRKKKVH